MDIVNQTILYFFSPNPGREFQYYILLGILIAIFIALTVLIYLYAKKHKDDKAFKKLFRNYPTKFIILAVLLGLYMLLRYNGVPFFSMRFLLYILIGSCIFVVAMAVKTYLKKYPEEKKRRDDRMALNKYIPKKKKKKKKQ